MSTAKNFGPDDIMVVAAFRYCLGRMTYITGDCANWLIEQWPNIGERTKYAIKRELLEAFRQDDQQRAEGRDYKTLGHDCDRQEWDRLRQFINAEKPE